MSLNVSLTASLERFVRDKVAQGEYDTASDVIGAALRLLQEREELHRVQEKIADGVASLKAGRMIPSAEVWSKLEKTVSAACSKQDE